ncbi:MAG TPA: carboxypeptidase M32, partial [Candidatus Hydrogenedentes bacterium]|nr:carboxypeptidase M32 [Candidatus Hydrogenedentota bacterium]
MSDVMKSLRKRLGEIADVQAAIALMDWDEQTVMPPKTAGERGQQLATLSAMAHRMTTCSDMGRLLARAERAALSPDDRKLVEVALYDYKRKRRIPAHLIETFAQERSHAFQAWVTARKNSDFPLFAPHLDHLLELLRRMADCLGYNESPYDAHLEDYERGITTRPLKTLFTELADHQSRLLRRFAVHGPSAAEPAWIRQIWDEQKQWDFTLRVLDGMGYDRQAGRQDRSVHPFTTSMGIRDVRITTRLDPRNPLPALFSSIHECGHALYDQGLSPDDARTPLAQGASLGIHESQSRLWENMIGRSLPFWRYCLPLFRSFFPGQLDSVSADDLYRETTRIMPSFIRTDSDECTYNLHIILRFELEVELIEGRMAVRDIPEAWNARFKQLLGLDVPDDAHGCLQDIHWSHGLIGYFPTYALGNLYAAQMFEVIEDELPTLWTDIESGRFMGLREWLREHVHRHGRRKTALELMRDITGQEPTPRPFLNYLEK